MYKSRILWYIVEKSFKNGFYKKYTENGIVLEESTFKNNLYSGLAVFRDSNGNLVSTGQFVNGKKAGIWQFFEKGKVVKEMNMSFPENATKSKLWFFLKYNSIDLK